MSIMDLLQDISYYWTKQLDPRVVNLPLITSSYQVPLIIFAYLYFVLGCGPRFMKNRPPYSLKTFIMLYNIVQILANVWLIYDLINGGLFMLTHVCPVFDYSYDYVPMRLLNSLWYYFLIKILDYVETVVFVLRKKNNQVSALHLYHHVAVLLLAWLGLRYYAVGATGFTVLINCFIHSIMYTYYFLAAWGPNIQKAVAPMKQWITVAQMIQFVIIGLYASQAFIPNCKIVGLQNIWIVHIFNLNLLINFYMFYNFYQKNYKELKKTQ